MWEVKCSTCGERGRHDATARICPGCGEIGPAATCAACGGMTATPILVATGDARGCLASALFQVAPMLTPRATCPKCKKGVLSARDAGP